MNPIFLPKPLNTVGMVLLFRVGVRDEPKDKQGITHLIEHTVFRGTKSFPDSKDIAKVLDSLGAKWNAFVEKDHTAFHLKVYKKHAQMALKVLLEIGFFPLLKQNDIKKEQKIVLAELDQRNDDPAQQADMKLEDLMFPRHPLNQNIGGTKKTVMSITRKDLLQFYNDYFTTENAVLVISGDEKLKNKLLDFTKQTLKSANQKGKQRKLNIIPFPRVKPNSKQLTVKRKLEQDHISIGFPIFDWKSGVDSGRYAVALVLSVILGETSSSRLFVKIREERGLVYNIDTDLKIYEEAGYFNISFSTQSKNTKQAFSVTNAELNKLKKDLVEPSELKRAKDYLVSVGELNKEKVIKHALFVGQQRLYTLRKQDLLVKHKTKPISLDTLNDLIKDVKAHQIRDLAKLIFNDKQKVIVVVGA